MEISNLIHNLVQEIEEYSQVKSDQKTSSHCAQHKFIRPENGLHTIRDIQQMQHYPARHYEHE